MPSKEVLHAFYRLHEANSKVPTVPPMPKPLLCRLGIHRPFTSVPSKVYGLDYATCTRCNFYWLVF